MDAPSSTMKSVRSHDDAAKPYQFTLRTVVGVFWIVCVVLATLRTGIVSVVAFGIPVAALGYDFIAHGRFRRIASDGIDIPRQILNLVSVIAMLLIVTFLLATAAFSLLQRVHASTVMFAALIALVVIGLVNSTS